MADGEGRENPAFKYLLQYYKELEEEELERKRSSRKARLISVMVGLAVKVIYLIWFKTS